MSRERQEAQNPSTNPERLKELSRHHSAIIRRLVAQNPNISPALVCSPFSADFPAEILQNPAFTLFQLEDEQLLQKLPKESLLSLLTCTLAPESLLKRALEHTPEATRKYLATKLSRIDLLWRIAKYERALPIRWALLDNKSTPFEVLLWLLGDPEPSLRASVSKECDAASAPEEKKRIKLYRDILQRAGSTRDLTREAEPDLSLGPEDLFLLQGAGPFGKKLVARHPNTTPEILAALSNDESWMVRQEVAQHPNTTPRTLRHLAEDPLWLIRSVVAHHPSTPQEALRLLAQDTHPLLSLFAEKRLERLR